MGRFIFLLIFGASLSSNCVFSEKSSSLQKTSSNAEAKAFASSSSYATASSSATASSFVTSSSATASSCATTSSSATASSFATASSSTTSSTNSTNVKCGKNQIYDLCPSSCPPRTCETKDIAFSCVTPLEPGDPKCPKPKCRCDNNYYSNDKGECVTKQQCPTKTCGFNEIYYSCPFPTCANQTCENIGKKFSCPAIPADYPCKGECRCKPGYSRNKIGQCISEEQCKESLKCGKNKVYDICPPSCPPMTCASKDIAFKCKEPLKPGNPDCPQPKCRCEPGYYSNGKGECVTKQQCPTKTCDFNEIYYSCPFPTCANQTCENIGKKFNCPEIPADYPCKGECRCKPRYYRNKIGQCISEEQCKESLKCGKNKVYDICPPSCPPMTCATKDIAFKCKEPLKPGNPDCPQPKCRCALNYYSNDKGECVLKEQCPTKNCGTNEIYESCPAPLCGGQICENIGKVFPCPLIPPNHPCKGECRCKPGYYKNKIGECISEEDCKKCPGKYEYFSCGSACDNVCATLSTQNRTNCPIINIVCNKMCYCLDGYARDANGTCVPISECPPTETCGANEVYEPCPKPTCANQTCENIGKKFNCPLLPSKYPCKGQCRCKPGYYRNKIGECISEEDCKKCPGKYEYFSCGSACDNVCATLSKQNRTNCPIKNIKCNPKCYCLDGYARDANGTCVPISKCPPTKTCGANEIYEPCPKPTCANQTCENIGKKFNCPAFSGDYPCKGECRCKPGYYRNKIGECISEEDCKKCTGEYEYFSCGSACDNVCATLGKQNRTNCPIINKKCNPMCYCLDGYARDANGTCVPISKCPPTKTCGSNELYEPCPTPTCVNQTCENIGKIFFCPLLPSKYPCKGECRCKPGYYRNKIGECISEEDCKKCPGKYEYFSCGSACDNVCATLSTQNRTNCPIINIVCNKMCYCLDGYARDANGTCVPVSECPPLQCGPNQVASDCANSPCIRNCATKDLNLQCRPYPPGCKKGCVSADGYLKDNNGVCVPINKCPPNDSRCNDNEEYSDCPNQVCRAEKCDELGFPLACDQGPRNSTDCGKPGCICKIGYLKNKDGKCVDNRSCPSCGRDPNAWSGCGTFCTTCENYKDKSRPCSAACWENGCDCRPGYVFDSKGSKKCVLPEQCPVSNK